MSYVSARYIEMIGDDGQMSTDTYLYATTDVGKVELVRADAIDTEWVRFLNEGGKIAPNEIPALSGISPSTAELGGADLTLTATGTGFTEDSKILFNNGEEATVFVSPTELTTIVKPSTASAAVTVPVCVRTVTWLSESYDFSFTEAADPEAGKTRRK